MNPIELKPKLGPAAEQRDSLRKSAQAFEAMLLEHWWSSMTKDDLGGEQQDPAMATFQSCGLEAMSLAMARGGGIGIAPILEKALDAKIAAEVRKPAGPGMAGR